MATWTAIETMRTIDDLPRLESREALIQFPYRETHRYTN